MFGQLLRDSSGFILCDKCGKHRKYYSIKPSQLARDFISAPFCKRKLIHLCFGCARLFSTMAGGEAQR